MSRFAFHFTVILVTHFLIWQTLSLLTVAVRRSMSTVAKSLCYYFANHFVPLTNCHLYNVATVSWQIKWS